MNKKQKMNDIYGKALLDLANNDERVVVIDADVQKRMGTLLFKQKYPDRHINVGIAEQNMVGIASGLAATGKICFIGSIAMFVTGRTWEQLRQFVAYPNLNVKVVGNYSGLAAGPDGATHQACEDISIIRSIPNFKILVPCDSLEAEQATILAYSTEGPVYIRLVRPAVEKILPPNYRMRLGQAVEISEGKDITMIACGMMVKIAIDVANKLKKDNIHARVLNMSSIKPIDKKAIILAAIETKNIVTLEDHSIIGGLGSAVSEVMAEGGLGKLKRIGVKDCFGESGTCDELYEKHGLTVSNIVHTIKDILNNQ